MIHRTLTAMMAALLVGLTRIGSPISCDPQNACAWDYAGTNTYACTYDSLSGECCQKTIYSVHCSGDDHWETQVDVVVIAPSGGCRGSGLCLVSP